MRLDGSVCTDSEGIRTSGSGHVCFPVNKSASTLLQLETRSKCRGDRCLHTGLESVSRICKSSVVSVAGHPFQNKAPEGTGSAGCSHMGDPTLVSTNSGNANQLSTVVATRAMDSDLK